MVIISIEISYRWKTVQSLIVRKLIGTILDGHKQLILLDLQYQARFMPNEI